MEQGFISLVIGVSLSCGMCIGAWIAGRTHRKAATKVIESVVIQSVKATNIIATMYIDLAVEHVKCTPDDAMNKVVSKLAMDGVHVSTTKIRGSNDVNKVIK